MNKVPSLSPNEVVIKLKSLTKKIESFLKETDDGEIKINQLRVVFPIMKDCKGYSMQELSEQLNLDKSFVSRTIAYLESKDIVERDKEPDSKERNYRIILTDNGKKLLMEKITKREKIVTAQMPNITEQDMADFIRLLKKFTE